MKQPIVFITGNMNKLMSTQRYIDFPFEHKKIELEEIQSLDIDKVVEHKVKEAYKILGKPVLVEDTSFIFHSLGKLPGTFIRWFLEEIGNEGMCRLIDERDRSATIAVVYGLYDGKTLHICKGEMNGSVAEHPRGKNGFGWDPIFIPEGFTKTHAELSPEELDAISVRRIATDKLKKVIKSYE